MEQRSRWWVAFDEDDRERLGSNVKRILMTAVLHSILSHSPRAAPSLHRLGTWIELWLSPSINRVDIDALPRGRSAAARREIGGGRRRQTPVVNETRSFRPINPGKAGMLVNQRKKGPWKRINHATTKR